METSSFAAHPVSQSLIIPAAAGIVGTTVATVGGVISGIIEGVNQSELPVLNAALRDAHQSIDFQGEFLRLVRATAPPPVEVAAWVERVPQRNPRVEARVERVRLVQYPQLPTFYMEVSCSVRVFNDSVDQLSSDFTINGKTSRRRSYKDWAKRGASHFRKDLTELLKLNAHRLHSELYGVAMPIVRTMPGPVTNSIPTRAF